MMEARFLGDEEIAAFGVYLTSEIHPTFYRVIGCFDESDPAGAMVLDFLDDAVALVEWIYVGEAYRGKGVAKCMVEYLAKWAEAEEIIIQTNYAYDALLNHLFTENGFELELHEIPRYVIEIEKAERVLDRLDKSEEKTYEILPIEEVTEEKFIALIGSFDKEEDAEIPVSRDLLSEADQGMSRVLLVDGMIEALLYVKQLDAENVKVSYVWNKGTKKAAVGILFADAFRWVKENESAVKYIHITGVTPKVCSYIERAFEVEPEDELRLITATYFGLGRRQ